MTDGKYHYNVKKDNERQIICLSVKYDNAPEVLIPFMDILLQLEKYKGE